MGLSTITILGQSEAGQGITLRINKTGPDSAVINVYGAEHNQYEARSVSVRGWYGDGENSEFIIALKVAKLLLIDVGMGIFPTQGLIGISAFGQQVRYYIEPNEANRLIEYLGREFPRG